MKYWENEKIELRAFDESDVLFLQNSLNSYEMQYGNCDIRFPLSLKSCDRITNTFCEVDNDQAEGQFLVIMDKQGNKVGILDVHNVDAKVGYFEYGITISPEYRRMGYAQKAILLLIGYFFEERRFQKVNVSIYDFNEASILLHEKIGFLYEGRIRRSFFSRGKYHDAIMYGMTLEEYYKNKIIDKCM